MTLYNIYTFARMST